MRTPKIRRLASIFLLLSLLLTGCTRKSPAPREVLEELCHAVQPLPAGKMYVRSAPEGSEEHLSNDLFAATFGNGNIPPETEWISDAAIYFSYTDKTELAVFLCKSADGTDAVAKMCLGRLDQLKNYRNDGSPEGSDGDPQLQNAQVYLHGRWVVLCVAPNTDDVLRAFRRSL